MRACILVAVLSVCAPAQSHVNGGLAFAEAEHLTIAVHEDGAATATVLVSNTATDAILPTFTAFLRNPDGEFVQLRGTDAAGAPVAADGERRYHLTFSGPAAEGATGQLVAIGAGSPGTVDVEVSRHAAPGSAVPGGLVPALVLAVALLGAAATTVAARRAAPIG